MRCGGQKKCLSTCSCSPRRCGGGRGVIDGLRQLVGDLSGIHRSLLQLYVPRFGFRQDGMSERIAAELRLLLQTTSAEVRPYGSSMTPVLATAELQKPSRSAAL